MGAIASVGGPDRQADGGSCSVVPGLVEAVKALCEPTALQRTLDPAVSESEPINKGRIVCLTSLASDAQLKLLDEAVQDAIVERNNLVDSSQGRLIPLDHCELVLVHQTPVGVQSAITQKEKLEVSSLLTSELHVSESGHFLANRLVELCAHHFDLVSTCITGIPMKEEQNASSSANYDVELLHPSGAHRELSRYAHAEGLIIKSKEGLNMNTVALKWCTPKSTGVELQHCTGAYRLTPVDVTSRPSSCLINFLLSGRSVLLEQPRKSGMKVTSHMLFSHGGEIYIHVLSTARSLLEDPPSISEGAGGRVTDYRINDFGDLMKACRLAPGPGNTASAVAAAAAGQELPVERARRYLEKCTRFWPITIGESIIFNMLSHLDPLPTLLLKDALTEDEVLECKKSIYHLVGMESRNEPLPVPTAGGNRSKGPKRDEQYRQMWAELEKLVRAHSATSPTHAQVLECLLECKRPSEGSTVSPKRSQSKTPEREEDIAWRELDAYQKLTAREKTDYNKGETVVQETTEPAVKKPKLMEPFKKGQAGKSLLSLWTSRLNAIHSQKRTEFDGRLDSAGNTAELYINLKDNLDVVKPGMNHKPLVGKPNNRTNLNMPKK